MRSGEWKYVELQGKGQGTANVDFQVAGLLFSIYLCNIASPSNTASANSFQCPIVPR